MNKTPEISVLIPVYNAEQTLLPSIWSVLNQSFTDFELLIYLDGCTDRSAQIAKSFSDDRIKIIENDENKGIVHARNSLVKESVGKYIAWLDADDIMLPDRLAEQHDYLEMHPDIFMLGTWVELRNHQTIKKVKWPKDAEMVKAWILFRNPLVQSSLMLRNDKKIIAFEQEYEYLEDYKFYSSIFLQKKIAIFPAYGCSYYHENSNALGAKYRKYDFVGKLEKIMRFNFSLLEINPGSNELSLFREFLRNNHKIKKEDGNLVFSFLLNALKKNNQKRIFEHSAFQSIIALQLLRLAKKCASARIKIFLYLALRPAFIFRSMHARVRYA